MPTEHEYKFLLDLSIAEDSRLSELPQTIIRQGYLAVSDSMDLRIRHSLIHNTELWTVTFKQKVPGRKIEIEQNVDARDGMDLWEISSPKIKKVRHLLHVTQDRIGQSKAVVPFIRQTWEIDLFYSPHLYFAMAEVELPEGSDPPGILPDLLQKHLIFKVPLTDTRFFNKNLGNVEFASNLYEEIQNNSQGATNG